MLSLYINEFLIKEYLKCCPMMFDCPFSPQNLQITPPPTGERGGVNYEKYTPLPMG